MGAIMMRIPQLLGWTLAASLLLSAAANAAVYEFSQGGYDEGATITGTFEANDLDGSGQIDVGNAPLPGFGEVSAFSLSFSGNSLVAPFSHSLSDLTVLVYNVGTPFLGDEISGAFQEGIASNLFSATGFAYASGMGAAGGFGGSVTDNVSGAVSYSDQLVSVSAVPLPAAFWLFASALPVFLRWGRRR